jgi:Tat protein secretion system quality control protein TatD with DNase activity
MLENERCAALVRALPAQAILTETDAPFAGEGSSPWDVVRTADRLASLLGTDGGRVIERIMDNFRARAAFRGCGSTLRPHHCLGSVQVEFRHDKY